MECLPQQAFFGRGTPQIFLTDNDLKERQPLRKLFPDARLLLCQFHVLKAVWAWLCDSHHSVSKDDRQEVYMAFKDVLYAFTEKEMAEKYDRLMLLAAVEDNERCDSYFANLWDCRQDWALAFRSGLPLRGSNTTNYIEVAFRILKDCVFDRVMAYSLPQLVDFIVVRYEAYMEKRLLDFSSGRYCRALLRSMIPHDADIASTDIGVVDAAACMYTVNSTSGGDVYSVDLSRGYCTCYDGATGKLCKHASAVLLQLDTQICSAYNVVNQETKLLLFKVATGQTPPSDWLLPLACPASADVLQNITEQHLIAGSNDVVANKESIPVTFAATDMARLDGLLARIKQGLAESPDSFVPACRRMLDNADKFASTDTGLLTAMHTFAKYSGLQPAKCRSVLSRFATGKRRGIQIGVQPTAVGRRRQTLSGKRRLSAGRPAGLVSARASRQLAAHDYTSLGTLPTRKRKAPHSLQQCVYANVGLGGKKQAKS